MPRSYGNHVFYLEHAQDLIKNNGATLHIGLVESDGQSLHYALFLKLESGEWGGIHTFRTLDLRKTSSIDQIIKLASSIDPRKRHSVPVMDAENVVDPNDVGLTFDE